MEALAKSLGVRAQFLGAQPRSEVLRLMAASRVFVFPSVRAPSGDAEGMGVVAMEAQAQGTPVIAFNGGPAPEAIADDRSGLLAIDRDVDSLSQCIKTLLVDDQLAERLSLGGPGVARERFDLNVNYAALEDLYDRVFARRELRTA
jgi:glycosyltransferase involved in cell wall biosynthesis